MKYSKWKVPSAPPVIPADLLRAGCTPLLSAVLELRGLGGLDDAERFLLGGAETLHDPLTLEDVIPAVQRLTRAIEQKEHIAVYGDYDVDGITSACLLTDYLRSRGVNCETYIPNRLGEGYGLNNDAIDYLASLGVTLIVTVDCGVTSLEETDYANSLGIDMIITDHHECRETLPDAEAVVDPKRSDCRYAGTGLAGVGVAFKLVCALEGNTERMLDRYGDLLAVGTVADVMPVTGENRYMIQRGLQKIAGGSCRPGLLALMEEAGVADKRIGAATIGYSLAPRINAAGRLGDTDIAVELLQTRDRRRAEELARALCQRNRERQELELQIWQDARARLDAEPPRGPIVLAHEDWHPGVIGIVASRLTDAYSLPAIMICLDGEKGKGSCRSVGDFNLYEALTVCEDMLEGFGGHAMAAGLTIHRDRVDEFRDKLAEYWHQHPSDYEPALEADLWVTDASLLEMDCVESLDSLEPCGNGNPRPLLYMENARLESVTPIGGGKHLRLRLQKFDRSYDAVFFGQTVQELGVRVGQTVDIIFAPQINEFRSRRSVQLVLSDLRAHRG
ncbi:MAG: single-stranded-DNA-specific exonuclease RecJ [Ruminococcaceae bacterium]|nr:single-stranded-DNA-specific exonuclease RecJ [Oscillospiraceae bacterium]